MREADEEGVGKGGAGRMSATRAASSEAGRLATRELMI